MKPLQAIGAAALAALAFGAGLYFMPSKSDEPTTTEVAAAPVEEEPPIPGPDDEAPPRQFKLDEPQQAVIVEPRKQSGLALSPFGPSGPVGIWSSRSIWGLPAPRPLNSREKQAIGMLGTSTETHSFSFSGRVTLGDGSTVPGVPALTAQQVRDLVMNHIRSEGLAEGFDAAVRQLALPHNLNILTMQVSVTPPWADLQAVLGKPNATTQGDLWLDKVRYRINWYRYGWLKFGEGKGLVRAIQADMRHAPLVAPEEVAGGRSKPDSSKVKQIRPANAPPREVEALRLLGQVVQAEAVTRRTSKADPQTADQVRAAQAALVGKDVYPTLVQVARQHKRGGIQYLVITPSRTPSLEELQSIMEPSKFTTSDTTTVPGQTVQWHKYFWLELGVIQGRVERVRASVTFVPSTGL